MKFKVNYTKTVVLESEFVVDVPEAAGLDAEEWAVEAAYDLDRAGKVDWCEVECQGDTPEVTKL